MSHHQHDGRNVRRTARARMKRVRTPGIVTYVTRRARDELHRATAARAARIIRAMVATLSHDAPADWITAALCRDGVAHWVELVVHDYINSKMSDKLGLLADAL